MQLAALFVIYAGYLTVMDLLPLAVTAVLGLAYVRAIIEMPRSRRRDHPA